MKYSEVKKYYNQLKEFGFDREESKEIVLQIVDGFDLFDFERLGKEYKFILVDSFCRVGIYLAVRIKDRCFISLTE